MRATILRASALLTLPGALLALAAGGAGATETAWNHRGSLMKVVQAGNEITIKFLDPKRTLLSLGVQRGTVLFQGTLAEDKTLKGSAFVFKEGCDPVSYDAAGTFDPHSILSNFELEGVAPQWPEKGCEVTPLASGAAASKIIFTPLGMKEESLGETDSVAQAVESSVEVTAAPAAPAETETETETDTGAVTAAVSEPAPPPAPPPVVYPREGKSKGGVVRDGPAMKNVALDTLEDGDRITIVEDSGQSMNGYNWYKVKYPGGKGYHWGGLICVQGATAPGTLEACKP